MRLGKLIKRYQTPRTFLSVSDGKRSRVINPHSAQSMGPSIVILVTLTGDKSMLPQISLAECLVIRYDIKACTDFGECDGVRKMSIYIRYLRYCET